MTAEYKIATIKDFIAIPLESLDACLEDFKIWLRAARQPKEFSDDMSNAIGVPNALKFSDDSFVWLDDGLCGVYHIDIVREVDDSPIGRISFEGQP